MLPPEQKRQLESLCAFARGRETVWKRWGFARTIPGGQGLTALFYGASGTGKTLAASVVANELGLPLYRVDLSQLISKYIGETQKNIGRIFDAAESADCILFFDEADALFSRRTEAADAQDRYANAEIAYLLQRTEQYDGIILLATNLLQNFDEAFRRRIGFMIRFPTPDEAMREALWRGIFPEEAPLSDIDYPLHGQGAGADRRGNPRLRPQRRSHGGGRKRRNQPGAALPGRPRGISEAWKNLPGTVRAEVPHRKGAGRMNFWKRTFATLAAFAILLGAVPELPAPLAAPVFAADEDTEAVGPNDKTAFLVTLSDGKTEETWSLNDVRRGWRQENGSAATYTKAVQQKNY